MSDTNLTHLPTKHANDVAEMAAEILAKRQAQELAQHMSAEAKKQLRAIKREAAAEMAKDAVIRGPKRTASNVASKAKSFRQHLAAVRLERKLMDEAEEMLVRQYAAEHRDELMARLDDEDASA